jgi:hypothetical protein
MVMGSSILQTIARFDKVAGGNNAPTPVVQEAATFAEIRGVSKRLSESNHVPVLAIAGMKDRLKTDLGVCPSDAVAEETVRILAVNESAVDVCRFPLNRILEAYKKAVGARL